MAPARDLTIYLFAASMGMLALDGPADNRHRRAALRVEIHGDLSGIVLLGHQIGSFVGVWLGGVIHDRTGSYDLMWWAAVFFSVFASLLHLAIDDKPVPRLALEEG